MKLIHLACAGKTEPTSGVRKAREHGGASRRAIRELEGMGSIRDEIARSRVRRSGDEIRGRNSGISYLQSVGVRNFES